MRRIALAGLALMLVACSTATSSSTPSPSVSAAGNHASDLQTRLQLLFGEQGFILGKATEAAALQLPDYVGYLQLLQVNENDIATVLREAFGDTTPSDFSAAMQKVDADFVQYGVGVVSRNSTRASNALSDLDQSAMPSLVQALTALTGVPGSAVSRPVMDWSIAGKLMVDDVAVGEYEAFYQEVGASAASSSEFGLALADGIIRKFPDKFPGDPSRPLNTLRWALNSILESDAYTGTMATDAIVADRTADRDAAQRVLQVNLTALVTTLNLAGDSNALYSAWSARLTALATYAASGDAASRSALTETFVSAFSSVTHAPPSAVHDQVLSSIKVIDDQRNKSYDSLPADDRAAATAMQPVADAIAGA